MENSNAYFPLRVGFYVVLRDTLVYGVTPNSSIPFNINAGDLITDSHSRTSLRRENNMLEVIFQDLTGNIPVNDQGGNIFYENKAQLELIFTIARPGFPTQEKRIISSKVSPTLTSGSIRYTPVFIHPTDLISNPLELLFKNGEKEIRLPLEYGKGKKINSSSMLLMTELLTLDENVRVKTRKSIRINKTALAMRPFEKIMFDQKRQIMVLQKGNKKIRLPLEYGKDRKLTLASQQLILEVLSLDKKVQEVNAKFLKTDPKN